MEWNGMEWNGMEWKGMEDDGDGDGNGGCDTHAYKYPQLGLCTQTHAL